MSTSWLARPWRGPARLLTTWGLGQQLLTLGDSVATEADALISVEDGGLCDETLHAHAPVERVDSNLSDLGVTMLLPEGFNFLLNCGDLFSQGRLEVRGIAALRDRLSGGSEKLLLPSKSTRTNLSEKCHLQLSSVH